MNFFKFLPILAVLACSPTHLDHITAKYDAVMQADEPVMFEIEEFDRPHIEAAIQQLKTFKKEGRKNVWIRIDSYGGQVHWGMELVQEIESYPYPVTCVADSKAMSMGFYTLQACQKRLMTARAVLMAHEPSSSVRGNPNDIQNDLNYLKALTESFLEQCAHRMKLSKEELRKKIQNREWYVNKDEALFVGAVDGVVNPEDIPKNIIELKIQKPSLLPFLF